MRDASCSRNRSSAPLRSWINRFIGGNARNERLHGEVLGQAELVNEARGRLVPLLDALPELALIDTGKGRPILLALMFEDGADLETQLFFREGNEEVGLGDRPFL